MPATLSQPLSVRRQAMADGMLVFITLIWGSTFVLVKDMLVHVSPLTLLAVRFTIGAIALVLLAALTGRLRGLSMRELGAGSLIGLALAAAYIFQTVGLKYTTASNAGFLTGLSVVLVPIFGIPILKQVPERWAWLGVLCSTIGLALLSLFNYGTGINIREGDPIVFGCAVTFALQIVLISRMTTWADPVRVALVQVLVTALITGVGAALFEQPSQGLSAELWAGLVFLGLMVTAFTVLVQVSVQRLTSAVHAALIFTLEPVFAVIFGMWLQDDRLSLAGWTGAALILAGMLVAELGPYAWTRFKSQSSKFKDEPQALHFEP